MKFNKGFNVVAILLIIVGVLVIGGGAYYIGIKNNFSLLSSEKTVGDSSASQTDCLPTTTPWIKVLSPNGGETYLMGQSITITWETCNAQSGQTISLSLGNEIPASQNNGIPGASNPSVSFYPYQITNDGTETVTLSGSSTNGNWPFTPGTNYKISAILNPLPTNTQETSFVQDSSDNLFTIIKNSSSSNLRKENETCGQGIGNCEAGLKCAYPCGIPGCQYICMPKNTPPTP